MGGSRGSTAARLYSWLSNVVRGETQGFPDVTLDLIGTFDSNLVLVDEILVACHK